MKLFYSPGAGSLAIHILANELNQTIRLIEVDLRTKALDTCGNLNDVTPKSTIPAIMTDDGFVLTECAAILQFMADSAGRSDLLPPPGDRKRYKIVEMLNFLASEIHKNYSPLFIPNHSAEVDALFRERLHQKMALIESHFLDEQDYLLGETFGLADMYFFTQLNWSQLLRIKHSATINAYRARIFQRPSVQQALGREGLIDVIATKAS